jgi:hypothetical protein
MTKTKEYKTINPSLTSFTGAGMSRADLPPLPPPPPSRYNNNNNRRRGNGRYQNNNAHNNAHNNARTTVTVATTPPPPLFAAPAAVVRKIPVVAHKKDEVLAFEYNSDNTSSAAPPPPPPPPTPPPVYDPAACDAYLVDGVLTEAVCSEHVVQRLCEKTPVEDINWSGGLAETIRRCPGQQRGIIEAVVDHMEGRGFPDIITSVFDTLIRYEIVEDDVFVDWRESETRRRVVIQTSDWIMKLVEKMNDEYDDEEEDDDHR